jgi:hypothetical protein
MAKPPAMSPPTASLAERDGLLATKLHIPRPRPDVLARPRLLASRSGVSTGSSSSKSTIAHRRPAVGLLT